MSWPRVVAAGSVAAMVVGCAAVLDLDEFRQGEGGTAFIPPTCEGDDGICLSPLPVGWKGPAALRIPSDPGGGCRDAFPTLVKTGISDVEAEDITCDCSCGPPTGQTCPTPTFHQYAGSDCTPANGGIQLTFSCVSGLSPPPSGLSLSIDADVPLGGACVATADAQKPPATSVDRILCASVELQSCDEGLCAAAPGEGYEPRLCVYAEGDLPCPSAEGWGERIVIFDAVDDTRTCGECTCGPPMGGTCVGESAVYNFSQCQSVKESIPHDGSCVPLMTQGFGSVQIDMPEATGGACEASRPSPAGAAVGTSPLTVCCAPPL